MRPRAKMDILKKGIATEDPVDSMLGRNNRSIISDPKT
jgi:hypothetical protein